MSEEEKFLLKLFDGFKLGMTTTLKILESTENLSEFEKGEIVSLRHNIRSYDATISLFNTYKRGQLPTEMIENIKGHPELPDHIVEEMTQNTLTRLKGWLNKDELDE